MKSFASQKRSAPSVDPTNTPFHTWLADDLLHAQISKYSYWHDPVWRLDNPTPGQVLGSSSINWDIKLNELGSLLDPKWSALLDHLRRLLWSLLVDNRRRRPLKTGNLAKIARGMRLAIPWLVDRGAVSFDLWTPELIDEFLEDLPELIVQATPSAYKPKSTPPDQAPELNAGFTFATPHSCLLIISYAYEQSSCLQEIGVPHIKIDPFRGISSGKISEIIATKSTSCLKPVPDEIAIPILKSASEWLKEPATDIVFALDSIRSSKSSHERNIKLSNFTFNTPVGCTTPWHPTFPTYHPAQTKKNRPSTASRGGGSIARLRYLVDLLTGACLVMIQAMSGVRSNELCSLLGTAKADGTPACIDIRKNATGHFEHFFLQGMLSKGVSTPTRCEWLIGSRPLGSKAIPDAVRAVEILLAVYSRWGNEYLFCTLNCGQGLPFEHVDGKPNIRMNSLLQQRFITESVDFTKLPTQSKIGEDLTKYSKSFGAALRPHQWRKSFAIWMFRFDDRLGPAICAHFKHLSLAMTMDGYIGNDFTLLESLDSVRMLQTTSFLYEKVFGEDPIAGGAAKIFAEHRDAISTEINSDDVKYRKSELSNIIKTHDLRIYSFSDGHCLISLQPEKSRCNILAGTEDWKTQKPSFKFRTSNTCSGCSCYLIDKNNIQHWKEVYKNNHGAYIAAKKAGIESQFRVALHHANHAKQILKILGDDA